MMSPIAPPASGPRRKTERRQCLSLIVTSAMAGAIGGFCLAMLAEFSGLALCATAGVALLATGAMAARMLRRPQGFPVLTYHSVSAAPDWLPWHREISIRPDTLDRQLRLFRRMGLTVVDTENAVRLWRDVGAPPPDTIALHFDDGYLDTWVAAAPILRRHQARATVFVSTDFIAPDTSLRPTVNDTTAPDWSGYMSWRELRALDAEGVIRVEAHGTDHGRVETGPRIVGRLTSENVDQLAWMQWAQMPGDKHDWFRTGARPVPLGSDVRESAPSLSARRWSPETGVEDADSFDVRVRTTFADCIDAFQRNMGRRPQLFCWPQNRTCNRARALAAAAGFIATTGGTGRNTATDDPAVLSRVHIGQDYAGFRSGWIDDLAVRSQIRCFQGYMGWSVALAAIGALRRIVQSVRPLLHGRGPQFTAEEQPQ